MAYDEGLAQRMREDLEATQGVTEKRMFGGIAFMLGGHMVCGVHPGGAMYRVGKSNEAAAKSLGNASDMSLRGRKMGGFVEIDDEGMGDEVRRRQWLGWALVHAASLPPK